MSRTRIKKGRKTRNKRRKNRNKRKKLCICLVWTVLILSTTYITLKKHVFNTNNKNNISITSKKQIDNLASGEKKLDNISKNTSNNTTEETSLKTSSEENIDKTVDKSKNTPSEEKDNLNKGDSLIDDENQKKSLNDKDVSVTDFSNYDVNVFNNSVFFGDSLTEALSFYDFLEESHVLGIMGLNTVTALDHVDELSQLNPQDVFLLFGYNDMQSNITSKDFTHRYSNLIHEIKNKLPNCNIHVQSLLPVTEDAKKHNSRFSDKNINEFNASIKSIANNEKINYVDLCEIINNDKTDFHEPDGVHLKYDFYEKWLGFMQYKIFS